MSPTENADYVKPSLIERFSQIPCMKNSYFYGIMSGIGSGFAFFLYSSRPLKSSHVGFSCFVATTMSYWFYCRYNWSKSEEEARMLRKFLQEGTVEGPVSV